MSSLSRDCTVGFIGLGVMGSRMASRLLQEGWSLSIYARNSEVAQKFAVKGAMISRSPADLGRASRLIFLCLPDDAAVEEVLFGTEGIAQGLAVNSVVVDSSTIAPESARRFGRLIARTGATYLDAPVSGGQVGAEAGTLVCMVGGPANAVDLIRPVLGAFCRKVLHVGAIGAGQTVKACNQVAAAGALLGVSDAIALACSQSVDPVIVREVLLAGTAHSYVLDKDGQRIIERAFAPGFRARLMRKDLRIALEATRGRTELWTTYIAERLLKDLCESGHSESDWSAIGVRSFSDTEVR